ncbi:MAG TPA: inorganic phosphate transporter, partial [Candidatus Aphodousia gallistercoris]|nr:inorganic phosphate transporter [Candidatus Aphodousia gallistercoris]
MEYYFLFLLLFLGLVAVFDIFVGVSNDAVNFLNSALGCRIASFKTVMLVASVGVMLGATFSSGMMEIARSGVFNPQMFSFSEIMVVFFAVMVTDIILLDAFNSLGLPTSTTVSIVFELLGSALAAAAYTLILEGASLVEVADYINSSRSLTIISGILISVAVAFVAGTVVQYIARLIFTFNFEKMYRLVGGVYAGFCLTAIFYFLVMKGAKGASFMRPEWINYMDANTWPIVISLFVALSVIFQILIMLTQVNIFKIVILAGTFSLAFAFAGNDLVNFVGVPLAAWDSYKEWAASGAAPELFTMEGLLKPTVAATGFLLFAGLVMVLTLWFSRKAQIVIQTSINLSSSNSGEQEQFGSSLPGRMIVRASMGLGKVIQQIIPSGVQKGIDKRFEPKKLVHGETPLPFDYVRASINLVVSAILIASATSLKLPL